MNGYRSDAVDRSVVCRLSFVGLAALVSASILALAIPSSTEAAKVSELVRDARAEARKWQRDAVLVEVNVCAGSHGTIDPKVASRPGAPSQGAIFVFFSPSTGQGRQVFRAGGKGYSMRAPARAVKISIPDSGAPEQQDACDQENNASRHGGVMHVLLSHQLPAGGRS